MKPAVRQLLMGRQPLRPRNILVRSGRAPATNSVSTPAPSNETQADPAGAQTGWKFAAGSTGFCQTNITIPADLRPYVYTVRAKALSAGARVIFPSTGIFSVQNNGAANAYYDFDTNTFGTGALEWVATADGNGFILLKRVFVNNGSGTLFIHRFDTDATFVNDKVAFAWHQLEVGNVATAYEERLATGSGISDTFPLPRCHAAWGDSLTAGSGDDPFLGGANGYSRRLNGARQFNHFNGGVAGETSTQIKTRMLADTQGRNTWINLLWLGRNNATDPTTVKSDIASCVANLTATNNRYLVFSVLTASGDLAGTITTINSLNSDLATLYGPRYLDVLVYLQTKGDGSVNDNADIAGGLVPRSLRVDTVHLNATGYQHVADCVKARLDSLGW